MRLMAGRTLQAFCAAVVFVNSAISSSAGDLDPPAGPIAPTPGPNAALVLNATNTPGDATAMFIITSPGHYRFDRSHTVGAVKTGVKILVPDVRLDLSGFSLVGNNPSGQNDGVVIDVPDAGRASTVSIENGIIDGFRNGVSVVRIPNNRASFVSLSDLIVKNNKNNGVTATQTPSLRLRDFHTGFNGASGVNAPTTSVNAVGASASFNGQSGFNTGPDSSLERIDAINNTGDGVRVGKGSSIEGAKANTNGASGIVAPQGETRVKSFTTSGNGNHGIEGGENMSILDGQTTGNGQNGVNIGSGFHNDVVIRGNNKGLNAAGAVRVKDSKFGGNKSFGADIGNDSTIESSEFISNADGARVGHRITICASHFSNNTNNGLQGDEYVSVTDSVFHANGNFGATLGQFAYLRANSADFNVIGLSIAGGSRVTDNRVNLNGDGIQAHGPAVIEANSVVANGNGIVVFNNGSGTQILKNTIKAHTGGPGIALLGNHIPVLGNMFRDNGINVQDNGANNKIAPIQCDPLTAGPHDNWILN